MKDYAKYFKKNIPIFFQNENSIIINGDSFEILKKVKEKSIKLIFADPPYFLSNGGMSVSSGKQVLVNKGDWDKIGSVEEKHKYNRKWIKLCKKILADDGTIWISGSMHNIFSIGLALEQEGFKIINNITWQKTNPPPNLACRCFTHSTETILWARKDIKNAKHTFNYELMKSYNDNKQMKDVWVGSTTKKSEKSFGKHPTQKPEYLLEKIILSSSNQGDICLDLFSGTGTTGVVANRLGRKFIGIEMEEFFAEISKKRLENGEKNER